MRLLSTVMALSLLAVPGAAGGERPQVVLTTNKGDIVLELLPDEAPRTVEHFLAKVEAGFYSSTIFHRVRRNFMIQGGGFTTDGLLKPPGESIPNEADNGLSNVRGAVAMARRPDPHSATVQFFINLVDNTYLDHRAKTEQGWGYTVFGKVVEGMEVVDAIAGVAVRPTRVSEAQPLEPVWIEGASVREPPQE